MVEYLEFVLEYIQRWIPRLAVLPLLLISIILHEVSHGFAAYLMGDPTAKRQGRLTLNPFKHLDLVGTICMFFAPFGWAKPVPINPYYMKKPKRGMVITALAGPLCNLILTTIGVVAYVVLIPYIYDKDWLVTAIIYFIQLNCTLAVFNLIPFPPLDGSKVLFAVLPDSGGNPHPNSRQLFLARFVPIPDHPAAPDHWRPLPPGNPVSAAPDPDADREYPLASFRSNYP